MEEAEGFAMQVVSITNDWQIQALSCPVQWTMDVWSIVNRAVSLRLAKGNCEISIVTSNTLLKFEILRTVIRRIKFLCSNVKNNRIFNCEILKNLQEP